MLELKLPFWNSEGSSSALVKTAQLFWGRVEDALRWPLTQMDPETCSLRVLNLIAWQRDITQYPEEPLSFYRRRVKYAFANAKDSGSVAGLKRIFERLGVGYVEIEERIPDRDWDVVVLQLTDSQISSNTELLKVMMAKYGRTCRRYEFSVITSVGINLAAIDFNNVWTTDVARF